MFWWRKFEDGFIEQGGRTNNATNLGIVVSMPIPFSSMSYQILATAISPNAANELGLVLDPLNTFQFRAWLKTYNNGNGNKPLSWMAMGY